MECEVLLPHISRRGTQIMRAMVDASRHVGVRCIVTETYQKRAPWLMSYGLGHPVRRGWTERHVETGGRLIGWDLGYWDRDQSMRVTVDHNHPWRSLRDMPGDRWAAAGIPLRDDFNPDGPIILVGIGRKSREQFGHRPQEWELNTLAAIRAAYPHRQVLYRPKKPESLAGCSNIEGPIGDVLKGASLVVCRHSNVAIDACIAGVPVVCEDGAAAALYGSDLANPVNPDRQDRLQFLQNLAYWQYRPEEAVQAWKFLIKVIRDS